VRLEPSIKSCYLVPIHYGETLFGVYELLSKQVNGFSGQQRAMADTLALYISTAMENARLFGEVQRAFERINSIQQQLLQSQKMEAVGQLAGGIAHDLNNQLTVIQASVDLNMGLAHENTSFSKAFKRIRLATEKSANLIRQLLLFGRKHPQFKVLLDLNADVRELQEMLERLIGEDVAICLDLAPDLRPVYADATNIEQVVINMAINARDAMQGGGMIAIKTENVVFDQTTAPVRGYAGSFVCLSVSDTGIGIEKQYLPHIFEPFFTTKEVGKGTGLGLSVAYGIVETHNGWIDVESIPGAGTTFRVYLPAHDLADEPEDVQDEPISTSCLRGSGESILLVEDDPDVAALTLSLLAENGYTVQSCRTVIEACQAFEQPGAGWDLLLSDAVLPDGQGIDLVRRLRLQQPSLEAILFSGYADERASLDQIQREGLLFLPKPYTAAELLSNVREAIERRSGIWQQGECFLGCDSENLPGTG
jgi:two-component system cell cycle sensor histidine kinase/response regulator CckA